MGRHPATKPIELSYLHFPFIPMRCSCYTIPFIKRYRCLSSLCVLTRARRLYIYRLRSNMAFEVVFFRRSLWASRSWIIVVLAFVLPFEFIRIGSPVSKKNIFVIVIGLLIKYLLSLPRSTRPHAHPIYPFPNLCTLTNARKIRYKYAII